MKVKILIFSLLTIAGCIQTSSNPVRVVLDKDEVHRGEPVTVRLYVAHNDSIAPAFHLVVRQNDTLNIPIDENDNDCGVIQIVGRNLGINEYNGFVEILDPSNEIKTYNYTIRFKVIETAK